jgi:hypothetical protein
MFVSDWNFSELARIAHARASFLCTAVRAFPRKLRQSSIHAVAVDAERRAGRPFARFPIVRNSPKTAPDAGFGFHVPNEARASSAFGVAVLIGVGGRITIAGAFQVKTLSWLKLSAPGPLELAGRDIANRAEASRNVALTIKRAVCSQFGMHILAVRRSRGWFSAQQAQVKGLEGGAGNT